MQGKTIIKILSVWVACFIIGMIWGKTVSPDYSVREEVEKRLEKDINFAVLPSPRGFSVIAGRAVPVLPVTVASYKGDRYSYVYRQD